MRIAYLANYQGADLIARRQIRRNLALAGSQKIYSIASLLAGSGHDVVVFSMGAVAERQGGRYSSFDSSPATGSPVRVRYAAALDVPIISQLIGMYELRRIFREEQAKQPFDIVILYNLSFAEALIARQVALNWNIPIVLEYEDDTDIMPDGRRTWKNIVWRWTRRLLRSKAQAVFAPSPELLAQFETPHKCLLRGVLGDDIRIALREQKIRPANPLRVLFAGSVQFSKGVDLLCEAWQLAQLPNAELHIVGDGPMRLALQGQYAASGIRFHGFLSRDQLIQLLVSANVCVNPHRAGQVKSGNVFPFKMIEYLGAGCPVISTKMGYIEPELEMGICFAKSESPTDLAVALKAVCDNYAEWAMRGQMAQSAAWQAYAPEVVSSKLCALLEDAVNCRPQSAVTVL